MRILVLGAGATGGYFGARLLEAGCDVTFLVREARAQRLRRDGIVVESPLGDVRRPAPVVTADGLAPGWDVVLLSCKAWDLDDAIASLRPAVGSGTLILPLLNGLAHLDRLDAAFGPDRVLGGLCQISAQLTEDGVVRHLNQLHALVFGHRWEAQRSACEALAAATAAARFEARHSRAILHEMWEKWVLLSTLAATTCLMRATIGDIVAAPGGRAFVRRVLDEAQAIAAAAGHPARPEFLAWVLGMFTEPGSSFSASMLRDMEAGGRIEADHIVGDLLRRGEAAGVSAPLLGVVFVHLKAYEAKRIRTAAG